MAETTICNERHEACGKRMDSQANDIKALFETRVPWKTYLIIHGILFVLVLGSYAFTQRVSDEVSHVATRDDVERIIKTIEDAGP